MDIGRALTYFTEEDRWIEKTTIGTIVLLMSTLLSFILVGVLGFFIVMGYSVRLMRNVQRGVRPVLPEWDQWGEDLVRGLKLFVVQLVWGLPMVVVALPIIFGSIIADNSRGGGEFFGVSLALCGACLTLLYGIFMVLIQPGYTIAFARNEQISEGLQLTEIWQWTQNHLSNVIVVALVYIVGSLIIGTLASIVGTILCFIGLIVTLPLGQLLIYYFQYHLYGQLALSAQGPSVRPGPAPNVARGTPYETEEQVDWEPGTGATAGPAASAETSAETRAEAGEEPDVIRPEPEASPDEPLVPPVGEPPVPPEQPIEEERAEPDIGAETRTEPDVIQTEPEVSPDVPPTQPLADEEEEQGPDSSVDVGSTWTMEQPLADEEDEQDTGPADREQKP